MFSSLNLIFFSLQVDERGKGVSERSKLVIPCEGGGEEASFGGKADEEVSASLMDSLARDYSARLHEIQKILE